MEINTLSKSAQTIQEFLKKEGIDAQVIELSASTRTAAEAAQAVGCNVAQIVKSLVFRTQQTNRPILVLASGVNRVDEKKIAAAVGEKIVKADADFTREATGFAIGGIPPVGHIRPIDTLIDEDLFLWKELWAAAGTPHAVFKLESSVLQKLTRGAVMAVK